MTINASKLYSVIIIMFHTFCLILKEIWFCHVLEIKLLKCGKLVLATAKELGLVMRIGLEE